MKQNITAIFVFLTLFTSLTGCKKDPDYDDKKFSSLSGIWNAGVTMKESGDCTVTDGDFSTVQDWQADNNGNISIVESFQDSWQIKPITWKGTINAGYEINVTVSRDILCDDKPHKLTTFLKGTITSTDSLVTTVDYPMCPPDCLFEMNYVITKQKSTKTS